MLIVEPSKQPSPPFIGAIMDNPISEHDDGGYVTDNLYVPTFCPDCTPVQIAAAAKARGVPAPSIESPFRFADFGCGFGINLLVLAASYPKSEFFGLDLNAEHVSTAKTIANQAGLKNVWFAHGTFGSESARQIDNVDFAVAHGVYSWVSDNVRHQLRDQIAQSLRPGGLAFVSYNTEVGNAQMLPLRSLMKRLSSDQKTSPQNQRAIAMDLVSELARSDAPFFSDNPALADSIGNWSGLDSAYLVHEYFHDHWHLSSYSAVCEFMAQGGFTHCGDLMSTCHPNFLSPDSISLVSDNLAITEDLVTLANSITFRKDVFVKADSQDFDFSTPSFDDTELFSTIWPFHFDTISNIAKKPSPLGELTRLFANGPLYWPEIRNAPHFRNSSPILAASALRQGMATQVITRSTAKVDVAPNTQKGKLRWSSPMTETLACVPFLEGVAKYLPSHSHGGAVPVPDHVIDAIQNKQLHGPGSYKSTSLDEQLADDWVPFLLETGIVVHE